MNGKSNSLNNQPAQHTQWKTHQIFSNSLSLWVYSSYCSWFSLFFSDDVSRFIIHVSLYEIHIKLKDIQVQEILLMSSSLYRFVIIIIIFIVTRKSLMNQLVKDRNVIKHGLINAIIRRTVHIVPFVPIWLVV